MPDPNQSVQLIFNAAAGRADDSAQQLNDTLTFMQDLGLRVEVHMVRPRSEIRGVAEEAVGRGTGMIVVAGGDGTIDEVASALVGTDATLGIIPIGTRNNLARSLGIPISSVAEAVALLRDGLFVRIDVGHAQGSGAARYFLEVGAAGLGPALFPAADRLQRGDLSQIGDLLATLVTYPPSHIHLRLDGEHDASAKAHMAFATNMPYLGANFYLDPAIKIDDGLLDIFVFANLSKLDLIGYVMQLTTGAPPDPRIARYQAHSLEMSADPPMLMMADGYDLGDGPVLVTVRRRALRVVAGPDVYRHMSTQIEAKP